MKILVPWIFMKSKLFSQSFVAFANISSASSSFICANNTFLSSFCIFYKICWVSDFFTAAFTVMCDAFKVQNYDTKQNYKKSTNTNSIQILKLGNVINPTRWLFVNKPWFFSNFRLKMKNFDNKLEITLVTDFAVSRLATIFKCWW